MSEQDQQTALRLWNLIAGFPVESYEFPAELNLPHDLVDLRLPDAQIDLVYPRLIELVAGSYKRF